MFAAYPKHPRQMRELYLSALLTALFLFASPGRRAFASTLTGSWYLTNTNSSNFPSGSNYAQVSVSVDSSDKVTFNVGLLSSLPNNSTIDKFAFNWADSNDNIKSQLSTAIANAGSPLNSWSVSGSNGSPSKQMGGMGKYNYEIFAHGNGNRVDPLSFTMDLSGLGLSQNQILNDFQVLSSGGNGSGFFALHVAPGDGSNTFYLSGSDPVASPEPNALLLMGITVGMLLCVCYLRSVGISSFRG